jgi:CheY-like chemotaxis protein
MNILLVEDSLGDVRLMQEAFREANVSVRLYVAGDGTEAMAFLNRDGVYAKAPRPEIILLDLNMPKMDGRQALVLVKADESLKTIPTIILTTSEADDDIKRAYELNANCFLRKPVALDDFEMMIKRINDFWVTTVTLPTLGKKKASISNN